MIPRILTIRRLSDRDAVKIGTRAYEINAKGRCWADVECRVGTTYR